jgi:hypothetical protein
MDDPIRLVEQRYCPPEDVAGQPPPDLLRVFGDCWIGDEFAIAGSAA